MDSFNCHYCNSPILTNRIGFGKNECQVVTGDVRVCNNLTAKECLPFHPIGSIILCFEEDMLDIVAKKIKTFKSILLSKNEELKYIKDRLKELIYRRNLANKIVNFFKDDLLIKRTLENSQNSKSNILNKFIIYLKYHNFSKINITMFKNIFFNNILSFTESLSKNHIHVKILDNGKNIITNVIRKQTNKNESIYDLYAHSINFNSTNHLLYA